MENLMINYLDLMQLVAEAVATNNKSALTAYKNLIQCMIDQHNYEYESHRDEMYLMDDWYIKDMQIISHCLDKLMSEINKALY